MKNNTKIKFVKCISALFILLILFFSSSGCQTLDKEKFYINLNNIETEYIESANRTEVFWSATLTNGTVYDIDKFEITFDLFEGRTPLRQVYIYEGVEKGEEINENFNFFANGKIDHIEVISWEAHYDSFWNTYKNLIFVVAGFALIVSIVYIVLMIVNDLDLYDFQEIVVTTIGIAITLFLGGLISSWVIGLILFFGVLMAILIALIAHLIFAWIT